MREILFRGKRVENGEWIEGYLIHDECCNVHVPYIGYLMVDDVDVGEVIPETVGQYTGLKDKNGARIFEGDIVKVTGFRTLNSDKAPIFHESFNLEVLYYNGGFFFSTKNDIERLFGIPVIEYDSSSVGGMSVEVIGNVYESKGLIERGAPLKRRFTDKKK